ncbi:geranyllinalool synthase [Sarracenia purpurea var. burkii]
MQSSLSSIPSLVNQIKQEIFSNFDHLHSFVSPSAYDTAWLAMIPHPQRRSFPMFQGCLDWVLNNQKECGFWGESATTATAVVGSGGLPTIDALPATLACMVND